MFKDKLSPLYRQLLPESVLNIELPEERFADCDNCHHCQNERNFRFETKCCDYHPRLPNYIVGAILSDESPELQEGKKRILEKIKNRQGVTPYGIVAPMPYHTKFQANRAKKKGEIAPQAEITELKCPYLNDGLCSIYKYRSDICPVFYCMSSSGQKGSKFWTNAHNYMTTIERKLTIYALQEVGYPLKNIHTKGINSPLFNLENKDGEVKQETYSALWKKWEGQEIAFYTSCFAAIVELDQAQVDNLLGIEERIDGQQLQILAKKMHEVNIPDFLKLDKAHSLYPQFKEGKVIKIDKNSSIKTSPVQRLLLHGFNGETKTLALVQKGNIMKENLVHLLVPLQKIGLLKSI